MIKFIDLSKEDSKGLNIPIFKNAIQLKANANLIATTNKSYSCAASLLVLSSEEAIKAILVLLHSEGYNVYQLQDAKKFFFDHKIRHQVAQLVEMGFGLSEAAEVWENQRKNPLFKRNYGLFSDFLNVLNDAAKSAKPILKSGERIKKLQEFNDLKNNGLYVGFKDKLLNPEDLVSEIEYNNVKEITDRLFKFYEELNSLFTISFETRKEQEEAEKIKQDLKIFIDKALSDFSFKELNKL